MPRGRRCRQRDVPFRSSGQLEKRPCQRSDRLPHAPRVLLLQLWRFLDWRRYRRQCDCSPREWFDPCWFLSKNTRHKCPKRCAGRVCRRTIGLSRGPHHQTQSDFIVRLLCGWGTARIPGASVVRPLFPAMGGSQRSVDDAREVSDLDVLTTRIVYVERAP